MFSQRRRCLNGLKTLASVLARERSDRQSLPRKEIETRLFLQTYSLAREGTYKRAGMARLVVSLFLSH